MGIVKRYFKLTCGLVFGGGSIAWEYKWEAVRGILYERGWTMLTEGAGETFVHYGILVTLVAMTIGMSFWAKSPFWATSPKVDGANIPVLNSNLRLPDGLPDLRVADHKRVAALFENEQRDVLFPLMESERLLVWARAMKGNDTLVRLAGAVWKTHFLICLPKEGQWERAQTFVKLMVGQQSIWYDVYFNQKQIEQVWPELEWIPLLTAARLAYEAVETEGLEKVFSSPSQTASEKITSIIDSFMAHNIIELWGKKPPSNIVRMIPRDEYDQLHHVPNTNNLGPVFASEPHCWEDVVILRADLCAFVAWVRDLSRKTI